MRVLAIDTALGACSAAVLDTEQGGIIAARGIALAAEKSAVGVSTLSACAAPHLATDATAAVVAAIDARHGHVYLQVFAPGGRTAIAPRLAPLSEAVYAAT